MTSENSVTVLRGSRDDGHKSNDSIMESYDRQSPRQEHQNQLSRTKCDTHGATLKLMPCLHVQCVFCLEEHMFKDTTATNASFYACGSCGYKINKNSSTSICDMLKDVPLFLNDVQNYPIGNGNWSSEVTKTAPSAEVSDHFTEPVNNNVKAKREYLTSLLNDLHTKTDNHKMSLSCVDRVKDYLSTLQKEIKNEIIQRSQYLISLVEERKNSLIRELEDILRVNVNTYDKMKNTFLEELKQFTLIDDFTSKLLTSGSDEDIFGYHDDVSNACLHEIHQIPDAKVDVMSLKLDIPGKGKEQLALEKLFGSLTEGTVLSGNAELVASFNVDMKWPTSIAVSPSKEIVITGKTGTFETPGNAFFFDSRGRFHSKVNFDTKHVPLNVQPAGDGTVWMSNNSGELLNLSAAGRILRTVPDVFQGSGQICVLSNGFLAVASSFERKIHILNEIGQFQKSISLPKSTMENAKESNELNQDSRQGVRLNAITTNSEDNLIIGDSEGSRVIVMDTNGQVKFTYPPEINMADDKYSAPLLKCPSTVCCDPFDNILVADFTNDSVHLFSNAGKFLGDLLTKTNGLSCPNCMALDHEGKLYIGQYGGDVLIYRYMSYSKKA